MSYIQYILYCISCHILLSLFDKYLNYNTDNLFKISILNVALDVTDSNRHFPNIISREILGQGRRFLFYSSRPTWKIDMSVQQ